MPAQSASANNPTSNEQGHAILSAARALREFKDAFGRELTPFYLAELYVEQMLDVSLARKQQEGFDAIDARGRTYEVKLRAVTTQNIDINSFKFDFIVLVNYDDSYRPVGIWVMDQAMAMTVFDRREKYMKWQCRQPKFKQHASQVRLPSFAESSQEMPLAVLAGVVSVSSDVQSGVPVFAGTRVPEQNLLDYISGGDSIDEFVLDFPSVSREQISSVMSGLAMRG